MHVEPSAEVSLRQRQRPPHLVHHPSAQWHCRGGLRGVKEMRDFPFHHLLLLLLPILLLLLLLLQKQQLLQRQLLLLLTTSPTSKRQETTTQEDISRN